MKAAPLLSCVFAVLWASAAPVQAASCSFQATGLSLSFGNLDPSNAVQVVKVVQAASAGAGNVGDCNPTHQTLSVDILGGVSSRSLRNAAGETIPYTVSGFPITMLRAGIGNYSDFLSVGLTGTISAGTYANAPAGTYSDTVTIVVSP